MMSFTNRFAQMIVVAVIFGTTLPLTVLGVSAHNFAGKSLSLPPEIEEVVLGTTFNSQDPCKIDAPISEPYRFPSGITEIAFLMRVDPSKVTSYSVTVPSFGSPDTNPSPPECNTGDSYGIIIRRGDRGVLPDGLYQLKIKVNNNDNPVLTISLIIGVHRIFLPVVQNKASSVATTTTPTTTPTSTLTATPTTTPTNTPTTTPTSTLTATPTTTPTNTPTSTPESIPVSGHWIGTTNRSQPMSFDVLGNSRQWDKFKLKTDFSAPNCGSSGTIEITVSGTGSITDNQFSYTTSTYSFTGRFSDRTNATGTYMLNNYQLLITLPYPPYICYAYVTQSGTWTGHVP
jgi:hypothetical protein